MGLFPRLLLLAYLMRPGLPELQWLKQHGPSTVASSEERGPHSNANASTADCTAAELVHTIDCTPSCASCASCPLAYRLKTVTVATGVIRAVLAPAEDPAWR